MEDKFRIYRKTLRRGFPVSIPPQSSGDVSAHRHAIQPDEYARIIAKVYEPDLDWDNPAEYDLLDRTELTEDALKMLKALRRAGFTVARECRPDDLHPDELDDLVLDEFE